MNIIKKLLFSTRAMAVMLLIYAVAMAVATFIENDYGTPAAKQLVYYSVWFSVLGAFNHQFYSQHLPISLVAQGQMECFAIPCGVCGNVHRGGLHAPILGRGHDEHPRGRNFKPHYF
ncbi:hypothetical protein MWN41_06745 [Ornithobacterium rhinotracheale]|uniref:hypothetical protein n=1 Tax=Ornithobacterium rhinotracheale TaxID=28251 RepID=UPI001FF6DB27|nr:hypothetical protein [Ornithobacterium rhinotracheale]MCK0202717.1 hypothetical protein [Ornithobacterium rhinotracheale]